jgi:hypothetical protein
MGLSVAGTANLHGSISFTDSSMIGQKKHPDVAYANGKIHLVYLDDSQHKVVYTSASIGVASNTNEVGSFLPKRVIRIVDVLGRETKETNQLLFHIYNDGTVEKRVIID